MVDWIWGHVQDITASSACIPLKSSDLFNDLEDPLDGLTALDHFPCQSQNGHVCCQMSVKELTSRSGQPDNLDARTETHAPSDTHAARIYRQTCMICNL